MSLHEAPSIRGASPERIQANGANDPTPSSILPETQHTEELVEEPRKSISEIGVPIQLPPGPSVLEVGDEEPVTLALSLKQPQAKASAVDEKISSGPIYSEPTLGTPEPVSPVAAHTEGNSGGASGTEPTLPRAEAAVLEQSENLSPLDANNHNVTEEAVHSLDLEGTLTDQPGEAHEDALLRERLSLGLDAPLETAHVPLEHSDSTVPIAPSSPREELDSQISEPDVSPFEVFTPTLEPPVEQGVETPEAKNVLEMALTSPKPDSDGTPTPTEMPTPSNIHEDVQMLSSRLEIGLGAPVEVKPSPEAIKRSISSQAMPPSTPRPDYFSGSSEAASPQDSHATNTSGFGNIVEEDSLERRDDKLGVDVSTPFGTKHLESSSEANSHSILSSKGDESVEMGGLLATPMTATHHIPEHKAEEATGGDPVIIDVRTGAPVLELPENGESNADATTEARIRMDRMASMLPEAPSSPRSELESEASEIRTPTMAAIRIELLSVDSARQSVRSESHRLDFVDDARSERSVGTSIAPIAPNSPRFITPLLTPSTDPDEFSFYERGRTSSLLRKSSEPPLSEEPTEESPESREAVQELGPDLTDALNTSFRNEDDESLQNTVRSQTSLFIPLASVNEEGILMSPSQGASPRPRHASSPSTWSIHRASGWFHSPPEKTPGRPSMEVAEGEFSRPISRVTRLGEYPPDPRAAGSPGKRTNTGCIVM